MEGALVVTGSISVWNFFHFSRHHGDVMLTDIILRPEPLASKILKTLKYYRILDLKKKNGLD